MTTSHKANYEGYLKQLEGLSLLKRLTTERHRELLELTASAYIEGSRTYEQLKTAEFKHKQMNKLIWVLMVTRWNILDYPTDCVVEAYGKHDDSATHKPKNVKCLAIISGEPKSPLCVASKNIVHDPEDSNIADATWTLVHMDGKPVSDGMEISIHALLSFSNGSPVGRGAMTYGGSKTEKGGILIFHWDVSPDYRAVVKPVNAEGSGATLTIKSK